MKIYFKHYSGAITEYDYLFFDCMAEVALEEEDDALSEGWLPDDYLTKRHYSGEILRSHWYQARQTRINLKNFKDTKSAKKTRKKCKNIVATPIEANKANMDDLEIIFEKYTEYRGFKAWELMPLILSEPERKCFLIYSLNEKPIAFTFMREVGENSVFSTQFAWDYENPKLYLGKYANLAEIDYCLQNNKDYMYLGLGYEKSCLYKADYKGFEFWTGQEWSDDAEHYKWLCERDSSIEKTKDLDKIKSYDDKNFFK
tara:strand:- start:224 stop:994 length:771 start_codon:yes stop_codon:yes gene_type:complete